jgi:hypothetical protein
MSDFTERIWAKAGAKARARSEAVRRPLRKAVKAAVVQGLDGVDFASSTARKLAEDAPLAWPDFEGLIPSSDRGFTAADVRAILGARDD